MIVVIGYAHSSIHFVPWRPSSCQQSIGNMTPGAEFNILCDPEAARIVFDNELGIEVVMVPLEVTHTAIVTERRMGDILHPMDKK